MCLLIQYHIKFQVINYWFYYQIKCWFITNQWFNCQIESQIFDYQFVYQLIIIHLHELEEHEDFKTVSQL